MTVKTIQRLQKYFSGFVCITVGNKVLSYYLERDVMELKRQEYYNSREPGEVLDGLTRASVH